MSADGYKSAWRRLAIPILLRASGSDVPRFLSEFSAIEKLSLADVERDQQQRLQNLLLHCYAQVPYYRHVMDEAKVNPHQQVSLSEFRQLPILTKEIITREGEKMLARDRVKRHPFKNTSGGSTGVPAVFVQDRAFYDQSVISAKFIYNQYYGKSPGDSEINLWGSERDIQRGSLGWRERLRNYIYNRTFQNAFLVNERKLFDFVEEINRRKPVSMWVYVESIDLLARFIRDKQLSVHQPKFIISTAGTLYPEIRSTVEQVFRCRVYNQYGSREVGAVAFESLDQSGMRGLPYLNHIELVNGRILVTSFTNYSMPLLRYEIGDTAEPWDRVQDLEFGCEKKIFKSVTGRVISHFKTPAGGIVHGQYFIHMFYFLDWVRQFQVVQDNLDEIRCRVVSSREPTSQELQRLRDGIRDVMGSSCEVTFERVSKIAPSSSGKYMYTICNI